MKTYVIFGQNGESFEVEADSVIETGYSYLFQGEKGELLDIVPSYKLVAIKVKREDPTLDASGS